MKSSLCHRCSSYADYILSKSYFCESCYTKELAIQMNRAAINVYYAKNDLELGIK